MISVPPSGPVPATIMLVGEAPNEDSVRSNTFFAGTAGQELTKVLAEAGIARSTCFLTSLARQQPPNYIAKGKFIRNDISQWIPKTKKAQFELSKLGGEYLNDRIVARPIAEGFALLRKEITLVKPNVIITFGNAAMWALTGKWGIDEWRGSELPAWFDFTVKVIPTFDIAHIFRAWNDRTILVTDLRRALRESLYPEIRRPEEYFQLDPAFHEASFQLDMLITNASERGLLLSVDIETDIASKHILCIGLAWTKTHAICIPFVENRRAYWSESEEFQLVRQLRDLLTHPRVTVIGQNFIFDTQYIYRRWGFVPNFVSDTMLLQHVCFPSMDKNLGFLGSLYCEHHTFWKNMVKDHSKKDD